MLPEKLPKSSTSVKLPDFSKESEKYKKLMPDQQNYVESLFRSLSSAADSISSAKTQSDKDYYQNKFRDLKQEFDFFGPFVQPEPSQQPEAATPPPEGEGVIPPAPEGLVYPAQPSQHPDVINPAIPPVPEGLVYPVTPARGPRPQTKKPTQGDFVGKAAKEVAEWEKRLREQREKISPRDFTNAEFEKLTDEELKGYEDEENRIQAFFDKCIICGEELEDNLIDASVSNGFNLYKEFFENSDLLIVKDEYRNDIANPKMLSNVITLTELYDILHIMNNLHQIFDVSLRGAPEGFYKAFQRDIATLLTRKSGRELINKIDKKVGDDTNKQMDDISMDDKRILINYSQFSDSGLDDVSYDPNATGSIIGIKETGEDLYGSPSFIILAHELIHVLHSQRNSSSPPTLGNRFTNLEEQLTITGRSQSISSPTSTSENATLDEAFFSDFDKSDDDNYEVLNENAIRAEFDLPLRTGHKGLEVNKVLYYDRKNEHQWLEYFKSIVSLGLKNQIEEFVAINRTNLNIQSGEYTLLEIALKDLIVNKPIKDFNLLFDLGLKIDFSKPFVSLQGMTLLHLVCREGKYDILKSILNNVKDINLNVKYKGLTPCSLAAIKKYKAVVDILKAHSKAHSTNTDEDLIEDIIFYAAIGDYDTFESELKKNKEKINGIHYQGKSGVDYIGDQVGLFKGGGLEYVVTLNQMFGYRQRTQMFGDRQRTQRRKWTESY